jgi:hypothetical protein
VTAIFAHLRDLEARLWASVAAGAGGKRCLDSLPRVSQ